jgi:succinate dehydrogenase/fumarate reductase cytochrome b subunit
MIRQLHRALGLVLALFVFSHLATHLTALGGTEAHLAALETVQKAYRNPVVEPILIAGLLLQIGLGLRLAVAHRRTSKGEFWARAQLWSGLYLAWFVFVHSGAALYTRFGFGLETNFYWASGTLLHPVLRWLFYPYYMLAIATVFIHAAAALRRWSGSAAAGAITLSAGAMVTLLIMLAFGGWLYPITTPAAYQAYYAVLLGKAGL